VGNQVAIARSAKTIHIHFSAVDDKIPVCKLRNAETTSLSQHILRLALRD